GYGLDSGIGHRGVDRWYDQGARGHATERMRRERSPHLASRGAEPVFDRAQEALPVGGSRSFRGRGPRGYRRSDDRIREEISDLLLADPELDATDIAVSVSGGEVKLSGAVMSRHERRLAEDLVESVLSVSHVQNDLRVGREKTGAGHSETVASRGEGRASP